MRSNQNPCKYMNYYKLTATVFCACGLIGLAGVGRADGFMTQITQAIQCGLDFPHLDKCNGHHTGVGHQRQFVRVRGDGALFENDATATHICSPYPDINNDPLTFPGDSLILDQDTELWCLGASAAHTLYFPGASGNPGLVLNGGVLWTANSGGKFILTGNIEVAQQSYITLNTGTYAGFPSSGGGRFMAINGRLSGSGNLVLLDSKDENSPPQFPGNLTIGGTSNTFSGAWIVAEGWLDGVGTNSLGTNSILVDPKYNLQQDPSVGGVGGFAPAAATFEVDYPLNSAGALILTNGGNMVLQQNCAFTAVIINGTSLSAGTYGYTYLQNQFPNSFTNSGPGSLTVQPYNPNAGAPEIATQPLPVSLFAGGTADFTVSAFSVGANLPLTYQWQQNGTNVAGVGNLSGATNSNLVISNVNAGNVGNYAVIVSDSAGSVTSSIVALTLVVPSGEAYESAVDSAGPVAFYEFNDTNNPATGSAAAFDFVGGYTASYATGVQNGYDGISGPTPATGWPGFTSANSAAAFTNVPQEFVTAPPWNLDTNAVTLTAWVMPQPVDEVGNEILFCRAGTTVAGLAYTTFTNASGNRQLGYTWDGEAGTTGWNSGITVPANQWSFVALSVTATNATLYCINTNGLAASTHVYNHINEAFDGVTLIGDDSGDGGAGTRSFVGTIDDVAVFKQSLSQGQLVGLYAAASGVSVFPPEIEYQPQSQLIYPNQTAQFAVTATGIPTPTYHWQENGTNLTDGGSLSGSTNSILVISNVTAADVASYAVVVANAEGSVTSSVVTLGVLGAFGEGPYETAVDSAGPIAFYEFNDNNNPAAGGAPAYDFVGGNTAIYGTSVQNGYNGITGPTPGTGWPGFTATNAAVETFNLLNSFVTAPALNLNTNTVTLTAWVMPQGFESTKNAIIFCRAGTTVAGLEYSGFTDQFGNPVLGYTWNGDQNTTGWNSEITVPEYQWSFVALTITPTNATIYIMNSFGVASSTHVYNHVSQAFNGVTLIGGDSAHSTSQCFIGSIDDVAVFNRSLSQNQLLSLFAVGSGVSSFPPYIAGEPQSQSLFTSQTAQFAVAAGSSQPLIYQWQAGATGSGGPYTNLTDGGQISGSATPSLTITNVTTGNALDYVLQISNSLGSVLSSPATLTVSASLGAPTNWVMATTESSGDWTSPVWTPGNVTATPAISATTAAEYLGSTFEILPGGLMRTPASATTATFPGNVLTIDGTGLAATSSGPPTAANGILFLKQASLGNINFPKLIMNGGGINVQNSGIAIIGGGQMVIASNTAIFYNGSNQHGIEIDSQLSGNGTIQYWNYGSANFQTTFTQGMNVTGASNTFTGTWLVEEGTLLGSGLNALGTNSITIFTNAVLETTYNINNPNASLVVSNGGRIYLHENDIFGSVKINGSQLAPGTYTYSQLHTAYSAYFPASWTQLNGSTVAAASGSITIPLSGAPGLFSTFSGSSLQLVYSNGILLQATNLAGPWVTNATASPATIAPTNPAMFFRASCNESRNLYFITSGTLSLPNDFKI